MSKFGTQGLMNCLDVEHPELRKKENIGNTRFLDNEEVAVIKLKLPVLKGKCKNCAFCSVITTQGKIDELGVGGYASNQEDTEATYAGQPLKKAKIGIRRVNHNPGAGVTMRVPSTIIVAAGQAFRCTNRDETNRGTDLLNENSPGC
jgi:hypothetical protein